MVTTPVDIFAAQCGWGAKRHETQDGPKTLEALGLFKLLSERNQVNVNYLTPNRSYSVGDELNYAQRLNEVHLFTAKLAQAVYSSMKAVHFPIVIGGDHAIAIGTWNGVVNALQASQSFGLIWLDAHMDSHTPQTTPSKAIHGMPLAVLLGKGESSLVNVCEQPPTLNPKHVVLIGVRSFEEGEEQFLKNKNVKIYYIDEVKKRGFQTVFKEALALVKKDTLGFGVSVDLDAFDPILVPGVGSPEADGLLPEDFYQALSEIKTDSQFKALEIAEFNPTRDISNKTASIIQNIILKLW